MLMKSGVDSVVLGTAYLLLKERRKPSTTIVWYDKKYLMDPTFWSITLCLCLANFGYPAPIFYLPTFAKEKIPNLTELVGVRSYNISVGGELILCVATAFRSLRHYSEHIFGYRPLLCRIPRRSNRAHKRHVFCRFDVWARPIARLELYR